MIIKYSDVKTINNSNLIKFISWDVHQKCINAKAGDHHYKLLSYLSTLISNGVIFEFGTHYGTSSLALSVNKSNKVITYDIPNQFREYGIYPQPENVELRVGNIFELKQENEMLNADLIFVDVDHLGVFEWKVYTYLGDNKYKGIMVVDDIVFNQEMKDFWNKITHTKYDITKVGHAYVDLSAESGGGTGLIDFSNLVQIIE